MKKIVALVAIASLACGMIFAEPAFEPSVTLDGNATVKWGMDLDAGQHGFTNETGGDFKVKLWGDGSRELEAGDGIWAELKVTGKEATINKGAPEGGAWELNEAKLHFNNIYVGIKSGDCQVGEYKFDAAIRSADNDNAKWLTNVGPDKFSQGIVAGYADDNFDIGVDFRSYYDDDETTGTNTHYTSAYAIAAEAQLKDSNEFVEGLFVDVGAGYNLSTYFATKGVDATNGALDSTNYFDEAGSHKGTTTSRGDEVQGNMLGYTARAGYKFAIDDTYYVKPVAGLTGTYLSKKGKDYSATANSNTLVFGALFGWGANEDANGGVFYLDNDDQTKKVTPGVSVIAAVPLASKETETVGSDTTTTTTSDAVQVLIVPSVYLGSSLVENLKFAAYAELASLRAEAKNETGSNVVIENAAVNKDRTFAMAFAAGVAYDVKVDDITVTPKAGIRYANAAYFENGINGIAPLSNKPVFEAGYGKMGIPGKDEEGNNDYFNLKIGVDVAGLIPNTTFFGLYESANLLNDNDYSKDAVAANQYDEVNKFYNIKAGVFNIGCKISF